MNFGASRKTCPRCRETQTMARKRPSGCWDILSRLYLSKEQANLAFLSITPSYFPKIIPKGRAWVPNLRGKGILYLARNTGLRWDWKLLLGWSLAWGGSKICIHKAIIAKGCYAGGLPQWASIMLKGWDQDRPIVRRNVGWLPHAN